MELLRPLGIFARCWMLDWRWSVGVGEALVLLGLLSRDCRSVGSHASFRVVILGHGESRPAL